MHASDVNIVASRAWKCFVGIVNDPMIRVSVQVHIALDAVVGFGGPASMTMGGYSGGED